MKKKALVILAAGIGSRFGGGIKQLEPIDDYGHIIIDYSIHDAIEAGFRKIVFIIRHDIEEDFRVVIGDRIEAVCAPLGVEVAYAFQELGNIPGKVPEGRTKPWGTGHAVLACDGMLDAPFAVINADDYYGKYGFIKAAEFLETGSYGLVGYQLKNTLSEHGGVTRGICTVENGKLVGIKETKNIVKTADGAEAVISREKDTGDRMQGTGEAKKTEERKVLDPEALVSMNFWCYPASFIEVLRKGFPEFLKNMSDPLKDEYLLPIIADGMLKEGVEFTVLPTDDKWFGVTYKEDKPAVVESFRQLIKAGVYTEELY
nr:nucleotidyltransferase [Clostridia bacterium]